LIDPLGSGVGGVDVVGDVVADVGDVDGVLDVELAAELVCGVVD